MHNIQSFSSNNYLLFNSYRVMANMLSTPAQKLQERENIPRSDLECEVVAGSPSFLTHYITIDIE